MSIQYDWSPVGTMGNLAVRGGLAEYAKKQQERAFDAARQEDQQNFQAAQAAAQAQRQAALQEQQARQQAMRDWQNQQAQAFRNAQDGALQYQRQQSLVDRQREMQGAVDMRQQDRQNWDWQREGADGIEKSLMSQLSEFGKLKLTPGGQLKYRDAMKNLNAIQAGRANASPQAYAAKLTEFSNRLNSSGLESDIMENPRPVAEPLLDSTGKPTGSYTIMDPSGKVQIHQPREAEKEEQLPDFSSPDAQEQYIRQRIIRGRDGREYKVGPKGDLTPLPPPKDGENEAVDVHKKWKERMEEEELAERRILASRPKVKKMSDGQWTGSYEDPAPATPEEIQKFIQDGLSAIPEHRDVMQMRDMLKADKASLLKFDSLTREQREAEAKKARQLLQNQALELMGQGPQQDEGAFFQDTGPYFQGQVPSRQEALGQGVGRGQMQDMLLRGEPGVGGQIGGMTPDDGPGVGQPYGMEQQLGGQQPPPPADLSTLPMAPAGGTREAKQAWLDSVPPGTYFRTPKGELKYKPPQ